MLMPELLPKSEQAIIAKETSLELMWDRIQELKLTDKFAAQILYERYKRLAEEIPPPTPSNIA